MRTSLVVILLAAFCATAADARRHNPRTTSVYTPLDVTGCRETDRVEEGGSVTWTCRGAAGVPLIVTVSDDRFDIDAGVGNGVWESPGRFSDTGPRVEWRQRGGRPFAIIYRLRLSGGETAESSVLGVETIGRPGRPGCLVAWVDGRLRNANAVARARADARAATFRCGVDAPEQHGEAQ